MDAFEVIINIIMNASMNFLLFSVSVLTIHCFCDDRLTVTKKQFVVAAIAIGGAELISLLSRISLEYDAFISLRKVFGVMHINSDTAFLAMEAVFGAMCVQKSIGLGGNIKRLILLYFCEFMYTMSSFMIIEMLGYGFNRTGVIGMELDELNFKEVVGLDAFMALFVLIAFLYIYKSFYKKGLTMRPRNSDVVLIGIYCIYIMVMLVTFTGMEEEGIVLVAEYGFLRVIFMGVMTAVAAAMPYFIVRSRLSAYYRELSDYQQSFLDAELSASRQYREAQEETRAFRHDVQNNLSVIAMLMNEGKYSEAEKYVSDMLTEVNALSPKVVTGDDMLDSLISSKLARLTENGVDLRTDGVLEGGLDWKPMDICTVFANAIDNAFEACVKLEGKEQRYIDLTFRKTAHQRLITISNSCGEKVDCDALLSGARITSKDDKQLHGFGIQNIRKTVEKYGGMMRLSCADRRFVLEIILM